MKNFLRVLSGLVVLGVLGLLALIFIPPITSEPTEALAADWEPAPGQGEYVVKLGDCAACHTAPGGKPMAGGRAIESPMGTIWSTNITADPKTGIGNWTLAEFRAALVDGVAPGGKQLYPAMPYENYRNLSERDIRAMYDYIMNDLAPVENKVPETDLAFPFNQRWGIRLWKWVSLEERGSHSSSPSDVTATDKKLARGAYLVDVLGHCAACHSPRNLIMAQDGTHADDPSFLTGGEIGGWSAPDLRTAHSALQSWSDQDLKDYLTTGRTSHTAVAGEMTLVVRDSLQYMSDEDADAMVAYLRAISDAAPKPVVQASADGGVAERLQATDDATTNRLKAARDLTAGERLYLDNCNACHMVDGKGAPGVFPSLAGNSIVLADQTAGLTDVIRNGAGMPSTEKRPARLRMPAFGDRLSDADIATLETFLRQAWGNRASAVSAKDLAD